MRIHRKATFHVLVWLVVICGIIVGYLGTHRTYYFFTGTPQLCRAAERGDLAEVKRLVALGVSPSREEKNGDDYRAPLDDAIIYKNFQVVRYLVEHGAGRYNPRTHDDRLNVAAGGGSPEILAYLMQRYPDHDKAQLLYYAAGGNYAAYYGGGYQIINVEYLLTHGAQSGINRSFNGGERALHVADSPQIAAYLLAHGAQLNVIDSYGHTPLYFAAAGWDLALVKFYVEHGLDVNARSRSGESILTRATVVGNPQVIAYLKAHGARWDTRQRVTL